jgi:hypothetical protein
MKKLLFLLTLSVCSAAMAEDCEVDLVDRRINRVVLRFQSRDPWRGCEAIAQQCMDTGYYNRMDFACYRVPFVEPGRMPEVDYYSTTTTTTTTTTYEYEDEPRRNPRRNPPANRRPAPTPTRPSSTRPTSTRPTPSRPAPTPTAPTTPSRPSSNTGIPGSGSSNGTIGGPRIGYDLISFTLMSEMESKRVLEVGESVFYKGVLYIVDSSSQIGNVVLRPAEGRGKENLKVRREEVSLSRGCSDNICVFDSVIDLVNKKYVSVAGISYSDKFITKSTEDQVTLTYEVGRSSLALTKGCVQTRRGKVCVGDMGIAANNLYYQVVGLQSSNRIVVETTDSSKTLYQDIDPNSLVITK